MHPSSNPGRLIGALLLLQALLGALGNIILLRPALAAPGFLVNAAPNALGVQLAVMAMLAAAVLSLAVAIHAGTAIRASSRALVQWMLALATAGLALNAVEAGALLTMLSLSQAHAAADPALAAQLEPLATVVRSARHWTHYLKLMAGVGMLLVLQAALLRFALVPRVFAGAAVAATTLQLVAVTLPLFGPRVNFVLMTPAGVLFLALAVWLLVRGFSVPGSPREAWVAERAP